MRKFATAAIALALVAALSGCARKPAQQTLQGPQTVTLTVWLPCGLAGFSNKLESILAGPANVSVDFEIVDVWNLSEKLKNATQKPDLIIMPADTELRALQSEGLLDGKPVTWAYNELVVLVPKANPARIEKFTDLANVETLLLFPENTSAGAYARKALKKAGLLDKLKDRIKVPKAPGDIYHLLAEGEAQAALAYAGCVFAAVSAGRPTPSTQHAPLPKAPTPKKSRKVIALGPVPEKFCKPFPALAAVVRGAPNAQAARQALSRLLSNEAQANIATWMPRPAKQAVTKGLIELHMYCGAGIRMPVDRLKRKFEATHPGVRIDVAYAGSGCLLAQLTFARRGDLYMPGEAFYLDQAQERGFLVERRHIAYFIPVILVAKGNPKNIKSVEDLLRDDVKVAIGDPEASAIGHVTKTILTRAGIWHKMLSRLHRRALNVPELGYWVSLGSVDAAIVWQVQAKQFSQKCDFVPIPKHLYDPVEIAIGLLKFSQHPSLAREFMDLLASPEGQQVFREEGFAISLDEVQ